MKSYFSFNIPWKWNAYCPNTTILLLIRHHFTENWYNWISIPICGYVGDRLLSRVKCKNTHSNNVVPFRQVQCVMSVVTWLKSGNPVMCLGNMNLMRSSGLLQNGMSPDTNLYLNIKKRLFVTFFQFPNSFNFSQSTVVMLSCCGDFKTIRKVK